MTGPRALLEQLVRIPSVNPREAATPAETPLAEFVAEWARARGMQAELVPVQDGRANVVVTLAGASDDVILLETHLDTVEADGMTVAPYEVTYQDGRAYGRGTCDAKGQLAVFLSAMEAVAAAGVPSRTVVLAGVVDEEHRYVGVQELRRTWARTPLAAIVGEPTSLRMVVAHKGCMRCRITVRGDGGHSSEPWGRSNAISLAAEVVSYLQGPDVQGALDAQAQELVGPPSLAVTMIEGGAGPNILPETCTITIDRRTVPGEDPHQVWEALADDLTSRWPDVVEVAEPHIVDYALAATESPALDQFQAVLRSHGLDGAPLGVGHGTDASKLALDGVPCVVFGAGSIGKAHTADEYVPLDELDAACAVITSFIH
ncbi:M20 family metallopeptidase [Isoptericola variabilis]|uniref:M20 family metallopeptidase n=1 Tax=Isoptericola variabilis TaxID=139208 RepID=UPI003D1A0C4F